MGLAVSSKGSQKLAVRRKNWKILTISRVNVSLKNLATKVQVSRSVVNTLFVSCLVIIIILHFPFRNGHKTTVDDEN